MQQAGGEAGRIEVALGKRTGPRAWQRTLPGLVDAEGGELDLEFAGFAHAP